MLMYFGPSAGQQRVAMSSCALIYNCSQDKSITDSEDLIQIMNIGNELYSALGRFHVCRTGHSELFFLS